MNTEWENTSNRIFALLNNRKKLVGEGFYDWLLTKSNHDYYFTAQVWRRCYFIQKQLNEKNNDHFTVIYGKPGIGKSVFALQLNSIISPSFRLRCVSYDYTSFIQGLQDKDKGDSFQLDEGALILNSMDRDKKSNKLVKLSTIMRQFNLHISICITDLKLLKKHFRDERIDTLIWCKERGKGIMFTGREAISTIIQETQKGKKLSQIKVPAKHVKKFSWRNQYPEINDVTEHSYKNLKEEHGEEFIKELAEEANVVSDVEDGYIKLREAKRILPLSSPTYKSKIETKEIVGKKINGHYFVLKSSLEQYIANSSG